MAVAWPAVGPHARALVRMGDSAAGGGGGEGEGAGDGGAGKGGAGGGDGLVLGGGHA